MTITVPTPLPRTAERSVPELVADARLGDVAAYEEIVHRYHGYVAHVVRGFRLSDADAQDAVQMTWLRLVENLGRLRDPEHLGGWLATTASRECLRVVRSRRRELFTADDVLTERPDERFGRPEDEVVDDSMAAVLWNQVAALPGRGQELVRELSRSDPPAYAELATRIGIPIGSIGPTRRRYLERLRTHLESAGLGQEAWA